MTINKREREDKKERGNERDSRFARDRNYSITGSTNRDDRSVNVVNRAQYGMD